MKDNLRYSELSKLFVLALRGTKQLNLVVTDKIGRSDRFVYSTCMSTQFENPFLLKRKRKLIDLLMNYAPHLVLPRKTVIMKEGSSISGVRLNDFVLKNRSYEKTRLLNSVDYSDFELFDTEKYPQALLTNEYRINYSRLMLELLNSYGEQGNSVELCVEKEEEQRGNSFRVLDFEPCSRNDIRLVTADGELLLLNIDNELVIYTSSLMDETKVLETVRGLIPSVERIGVYDDHFAPIDFERLFVDFETEQKKFGGIKEGMIDSILAIEDMKLAGNYRLLSDLCDEKYDIAKQTGIGYQKFATLFYRYGARIDEMIDMAYEMLSETRDEELIWNRCEEQISRSYVGTRD